MSSQDRRLTLDLNAEYQLKQAVVFFINAQNVFNVSSRTLRYGTATPHYAKQYIDGYNGVGITLGIKGWF